MAAGDNINTYQGNPALAQGSAGYAVPYGVPDNKSVMEALDKTTYYHYLESQEKWARSNLQADQDAAQAAQMFQFKMENYLPGDTDVVHQKLNNFFTTFAANPEAVRLRTVNGKIANKDQFVALQSSFNDVNSTMAHASARTSKATAAQAIIDALPEGSPDRAQAEAFWANQLKKPFGEDLVLPPKDTPFNPVTDMAPPSFQDTYSFKVPKEDLIGTHVVSLPNIPAAQNRDLLEMSTDEGYKKKAYITSMLTNFNQAIAQQQLLDPSKDDNDLLAKLALSTDPKAQTLATFINAYNNLKVQTDGAINGSPYLKDKAKSMDVIHLLGTDGLPALTAKDISGIVNSATAQGVTHSLSLANYNGDIERTRIAQQGQEFAQSQKQQNDQFYANLANERTIAGINANARVDASGKDPASTALGSLTALAAVGSWAQVPGQQTVQGLTADQQATIAKAPGYKEADAHLANYYPKGMDPKQTAAYQLPDTDFVNNIFRKKSPTVKTETKPGFEPVTDPETGKVTIQKVEGQTVTQSSYDRIGTWLLTSRDRNVDNNKYLTIYRNPDNGKIEHTIIDNQGLMLQAAHVYDDGRATAKQLQDIQDATQGYLKAQGKKPLLPMSELINMISAAPVKPGTVSAGTGAGTTDLGEYGQYVR